ALKRRRGRHLRYVAVDARSTVLPRIVGALAATAALLGAGARRNVPARCDRKRGDRELENESVSSHAEERGSSRASRWHMHCSTSAKPTTKEVAMIRQRKASLKLALVIVGIPLLVTACGKDDAVQGKPNNDAVQCNQTPQTFTASMVLYSAKHHVNA